MQVNTQYRDTISCYDVKGVNFSAAFDLDVRIKDKDYDDVLEHIEAIKKILMKYGAAVKNSSLPE